MATVWTMLRLLTVLMLFATSVEAQTPVPRATGELKTVLCAARAISDCDRAEFAPPQPIDVNGDGEREWLFVLLRGGPDLCHVRHACFAIVQRAGPTWMVLLSGMGGSVGFSRAPAANPARFRDLIVVAANSADEHEHILYRWRSSVYRQVRRQPCGLDDRSGLCTLVGELILQ